MPSLGILEFLTGINTRQQEAHTHLIACFKYVRLPVGEALETLQHYYNKNGVVTASCIPGEEEPK